MLPLKASISVSANYCNHHFVHMCIWHAGCNTPDALTVYQYYIMSYEISYRQSDNECVMQVGNQFDLNEDCADLFPDRETKEKCVCVCQLEWVCVFSALQWVPSWETRTGIGPIEQWLMLHSHTQTHGPLRKHLLVDWRECRRCWQSIWAFPLFICMRVAFSLHCILSI